MLCLAYSELMISFDVKKYLQLSVAQPNIQPSNWHLMDTQ